jgi:CBS-domain-containing membrane protein
MTSPVVVVREDTTLEDIARTVLERRIGCVLVLDGTGKLRGIVTESDFAGKERGLPFSATASPWSATACLSASLPAMTCCV